MRGARVVVAIWVVGLGLGAAGCGGAAAARAVRGDLSTEAERSGFARTGRLDEVGRLCEALAAAHPGRARCDVFGTTAQGRALRALVVGRTAPPRPVLLIQGGIHAGEIEGKDAGLALLRDVLDGRALPGALEHVTIVFIPVINPDGHERFGPNHRPNQRGPASMGFRTNAANLNLNRDHLKVDTVELAAQLRLWQRWDPVVYVDLHTTDGAKFEHDVAVMVAPRAPRADPLGEAARALSTALQARLAALGHLPLPFYPSFVEYEDPASGFEDGEPPPRFSQAYASARGRLGILVETHSWRSYRERVVATRHVLQALIERAVTDAAGWRAAADAADRDGAALAGKPVALSYKAAAAARTIDFRGYAYQRRPSEISGGTMTVYDEGTPQVWRVPLRDTLEPDAIVRAPRAGYLVEAGWADVVAPRLVAHGLRFERLAAEVAVDAEIVRASRVELGKGTTEGRRRTELTGAWARERRVVAPGALWIPIAQPRARLAMHLFEPAAPDALVRWGFFDAVFEQKEYLEAYVAEEVARDLLRDPAVRAAFEARLKDPEFARDPQQRLDFFYRRHPSWDERKDLLPVYRLDRTPAGATPLTAAATPASTSR